MYSSVFSWRRKDMAMSSSLRSGAGSAFHGRPSDSKAGWITDCLRWLNDEAATHSRTQSASMKVACNWLTRCSSSNWVLGYGGSWTNCGPPDISETTTAIKFDFKKTIRYGKVHTLNTKVIILYDTTWGQPPYWFLTNVYISKADYG